MKHFYFLLFLLSSASLFAQEEAWVYFNAKPNLQFFLDNPLEMLSQRALDRRHNQNITVDFTDIPLEKTYVSQVKASNGIAVLAQSKWLNAIHIRGSVTNITALKNFSFIDKIDFADKSLNRTSKKVQNEKQIKDKINSSAQVVYDYGNSENQIKMLNVIDLHQNNLTGAGKIIAVLDAGFPGVNTQQAFERLQSNNQILGGYDFVSRDEKFYTKSSHGTEVLSTIAGFKEGVLVGSAPDASFYLFITEDDFSEGPIEESLWVEAAERADSLGVDIITTSLGYFGGYTNPKYSHVYSEMNGTTTFVSRGADLAFAKGIFVVAAAGNEGNTIEKHIGSPADAFHVLAVGSVTATETRSGFSSIGPSFDNRIKPEVMAQGQAVYVADDLGNIVTVSGTSFACPIMAGAIACLWQAFPDKTNQEIRDLVIESSDRISSPDNLYGYGVPDFYFAASSVLDVLNYKKNDFIFYPNPTVNEITFILPIQKYKTVLYIYSVLGEQVLHSEITNEKSIISLQNLSKGVYFYKLEGKDFQKTGKIIKQ